MLRSALSLLVFAGVASATSLTSLRGGAAKEKVMIVGSGNWGSAIAKIIGRNVLDREGFDQEVKMWVFQEQVDGKNLTDIINTEHENVKYLPVRARAPRFERRSASDALPVSS
jgi:hypothetical protein